LALPNSAVAATFVAEAAEGAGAAADACVETIVVATAVAAVDAATTVDDGVALDVAAGVSSRPKRSQVDARAGPRTLRSKRPKRRAPYN